MEPALKFTCRKTLISLFVAVVAIAALPLRTSAQIVAIGASNTQGEGVSSGEAWPAQLEAMLRAKGKPYSVSNRGISGSKTSQILARLDSDVPAGTRIAVIAVFAYNDMRAGNTLDQANANKREIVARLQARKIRVIDAGSFVSAAGRSGMLQVDKIHLTAEGHRYVASHVAALID